MTIEFDGQNNKLGINTASPTAKLQITAESATSGEDLIKLANGADASELVIDTSANEINFKAGTGDDLVFKSEGVEAMRITNANAQVGIGISTTSAKLHVANANAATQFKLEHTSATNPVVLGNDSSSNLRIYTGGTEKIRIDSSGHAIITNGVTLGTTGLAYDANNTLDDYEEGTWTPSFEFSSSQPTAGNTTGTGFYTKVGNMVTVWGAVTNANVTGGSGDVRIRDLPFTSKASANLVGWMGSMSVHQMTFTGYVNCDVQDGFSYIRPLENISGGNRDILNLANCTHGATDVYFSVSYQVN